MNNPVFIVSPLNRSGTNFLGRLLDNGRDFSIPKGINEDYFFVYSNHIKEYFLQTMKHWNRKLPEEGNTEYQHLLKSFGDLLLQHARENIEDNSRCHFKCPRPYNIKNIYEFIPDAKLIICVRDGRDTVESFFSSFPGHSFRQVVELWTDGVTEILSFLDSQDSAGDNRTKFILVKYEDIVNQEPETLKEITNFCGTDEDLLSPGKIEDFPIFGSSGARGGAQELHWEPVKKTMDFNPIGRWRLWSFYKKWIFKRKAGKVLIKLGYELDDKW
jgi:hypothetical protein